MGEWRKVKLGELGEVNRGRSRHRPRDAVHLYGGPYPFIQTGDIKGAIGRVTRHSQTYSEAGLAQSRLWPACTMAITIAANIAETALLTYPACFPDSVVGFIADPGKADVRFIEYLFRVLRRKIQHENVGTGSVQDNINLQTLARLDLFAPAIAEQRAIASTLGALDDKIDLNRRVNETLEAMARTIFKDWFVDFGPTRAKMEGRAPYLAPDIWTLFPDRLGDDATPKGWGNTKIESLLELAYGKSLRASDREKGPVPVYGSGGINGFHNQSLVDGPAIIVGRKGTVGSLYWEHRPFFPIDTVFYVKSKLALPYCYHLLETLGLTDMNTDAAVPGLNRANVYRLVVPRAPDALINLFGQNAGLFRAMVVANIEENISLAAVRDLLLPKLMSGEIRVKDAEKIAEAAL